jgi:hypothetical protein
MDSIIPTILILAMVFFGISMQRRKATDELPPPGQHRTALFAAIALAAIGMAYYFLRPLLH